MRGLFRPFAYLWASPTTAIGAVMVAASLLSGGKARVVAGVVEAHGGAATFLLARVAGLFIPGGAAAMTLGHVVLGLDAEQLRRTRAHERVHVRQVERWGPFFLPAYLLASLWLWVKRRDPYMDNPFEREAYGTAP